MTRRRSFYSLLGVPNASASSTTHLASSRRTFDPAHKFVTSPVFRNPYVFGGIRVLVGVYTLVSVIYLLVFYATQLHSGGSFFSYFTYLGYIGITAYLIASGTQTLLYARRWRKNGAGAGYPLQQSWPRVLQALHVVLYSTVVTFPFIVTIVYWSLLSSPDTFATTESSWSAVSVHVLNLVIAVGEISLTNSPPPPWLALPLTIACLCGYLGVAYITKHTQGFYPYSFLNPKKSGNLLAAYIVGIALGQCIIFIIVHFLVRLRQHFAIKYHRVLHIDDDDDSPDRGDMASDREAAFGVDEDADWEEIGHPGAKGQKSQESVRDSRSGVVVAAV